MLVVVEEEERVDWSARALQWLEIELGFGAA